METVTSEELNDATHPVNTTGKVVGKAVLLFVPGRLPRPVWAWGSEPTSPWGYADGSQAQRPNVPGDFSELGIG